MKKLCSPYAIITSHKIKGDLYWTRRLKLPDFQRGLSDTSNRQISSFMDSASCHVTLALRDLSKGRGNILTCTEASFCSPSPSQRLERIKQPGIYAPETLSKINHLIYYMSQCNLILLSSFPFQWTSTPLTWQTLLWRGQQLEKFYLFKYGPLWVDWKCKCNKVLDKCAK